MPAPPGSGRDPASCGVHRDGASSRVTGPATPPQEQPAGSPDATELFKPERVLGFSDGVFGVAITLLVIDLRLPPLPTELDDATLLQALAAMRPKLLVFAFTFIVLGMTWLAHHRKFSYIRKVDGRLLWLNLFYLMALCLVPFASSVLGEHSTSRISFALYATVMACVGVLSASLSACGLQPRLLDKQPPLQAGFRQNMILTPLLTSAIFLFAAALSLSGQTRFAHWALILLVPALALTGLRRTTACTA